MKRASKARSTVPFRIVDRETATKWLKETRIVARRVAAVAEEASRDGLDPTNAVIAATIDVCFSEMTDRAIADWFRMFARGLESDEVAGPPAPARATTNTQPH